MAYKHCKGFNYLKAITFYGFMDGQLPERWYKKNYENFIKTSIKQESLLYRNAPSQSNLPLSMALFVSFTH